MLQSFDGIANISYKPPDLKNLDWKAKIFLFNLFIKFIDLLNIKLN